MHGCSGWYWQWGANGELQGPILPQKQLMSWQNPSESKFTKLWNLVKNEPLGKSSVKKEGADLWKESAVAFSIPYLPSLNTQISGRLATAASTPGAGCSALIVTTPFCPWGEEIIIQAVQERDWNLCTHLQILPTTEKDWGKGMSVNYTVTFYAFVSWIFFFLPWTLVSFKMKSLSGFCLSPVHSRLDLLFLFLSCSCGVRHAEKQEVSAGSILLNRIERYVLRIKAWTSWSVQNKNYCFYLNHF